MSDSLSGFVGEDQISCCCSAEKRILEDSGRFRAMQSTIQVANLIFDCCGHCKARVGGQQWRGFWEIVKTLWERKFPTKGILELVGYN